MTREEAIKVANEMYGWVKTDREREALETLVPELAESEDERIRKIIIKHFEEIANRNEQSWINLDIPYILAYLEKQKEQDKCPEYCVRSHCIGCSIYEKEKEKKPILEVFGFKVGDAVRLKDGDGRKHIIKSFEEVEGVHGPNFYHVEFEDNSARDGIYPGKEYPNGYYTQMEKFEEEQKPIYIGQEGYDATVRSDGSISYKQKQKPVEYLDKDKVYAIITKLINLSYSTRIPINSDEYKELGEIASDVRSLLDYPIEQKQEWSEEDKRAIDHACVALRAYANGDPPKFLPSELIGYADRLQSLRPSWKPSEEQMKELRECGECKRSIKKLYEDLQKRYGTC